MAATGAVPTMHDSPSSLSCPFLVQAQALVAEHDWPAGSEAAQAALALAEARHDAVAVAQALELQSQCLWMLSEHGAAVEVTLQAAAARQGLQDWVPYVENLARLTVELCRLELYEDALRFAMRALEAAQLSQDAVGLARAVGCLANVHASNGDFDSAESLHLQSLSRARESQSRRDHAVALNNLLSSANTACGHWSDRGEPQRAQNVAQRSAKFVSQAIALVDDPAVSGPLACGLVLNIGQSLNYQGDSQRALEYFMRGRDAAQGLQSRVLGLNAQHCIADWYIHNHLSERAIPTLMALNDVDEVQSSDSWQRGVWGSLVQAWVGMGRADEAAVWRQAMQALARRCEGERAALTARLYASSQLAWKVLGQEV